MKSIKFIAIGILFFLAHAGQAQISVNVNLGAPPQWGPAGYDNVKYYYLPDVEAYYDVPSSMFIYYNGVSWVHRSYLPSRYRNYDLYSGYKVVMSDYRGNTPYRNFRVHKKQYAKGYHGHPQPTYGQRPAPGQGNKNVKNYSKSQSNQSFDRNSPENDGRGKTNNKQKSRGHETGKGKNKK